MDVEIPEVVTEVLRALGTIGSILAVGVGAIDSDAESVLVGVVLAVLTLTLHVRFRRRTNGETVLEVDIAREEPHDTESNDGHTSELSPPQLGNGH